jgi:hypothetical protein
MKEVHIYVSKGHSARQWNPLCTHMQLPSVMNHLWVHQHFEEDGRKWLHTYSCSLEATSGYYEHDTSDDD